MHVAFVTTTQHGHLNPAIPTMGALRSKGCKVTLLLLVADGGSLSEERRAALDPIEVREVGEVHIGPWSGPPEAIRELLETTPMARDVETAIRDLKPDFVLVDSFPLTVPAVVGTHLSGVPYALTSANIGPITPREFRSMRWAYDEITREYLERHGVRWSEASHSPRSPVLNLAPAIHELVGEEAVLDDVQLAGLPGANALRGDETPFEHWERLDPDRPLVYVSFGTIFFRRPELLRQVLEATSDLGVQVVASVGTLGDELADIGDHILLSSYVPQREILERADLFVTHGGYNSVAESVRTGTPMLVIPLAIDQPVQAHYVASAGFGISLKPEDATTPAVRSALETLLDPKEGYGDRVRAVQDACGDNAQTTADLVVAAIQGG